MGTVLEELFAKRLELSKEEEGDLLLLLLKYI